MAKKKIITQHCPGCNYAYQLTTFFNDSGKVIETKVTQGEKPFTSIPEPFTGPNIFCGLPHTSYVGVFCPRCGVFLNKEKHTTITEEKIE